MKKIDFYSETFVVFCTELLKRGAQLLPSGAGSYSQDAYRIWSLEHPDTKKSVMQMIMDEHTRGNSYWNDHLSDHRVKIKEQKLAGDVKPPYLPEQGKLVAVAFKFLECKLPNKYHDLSIEDQAPLLYEKFLETYCKDFLKANPDIFIGFSKDRHLKIHNLGASKIEKSIELQLPFQRLNTNVAITTNEYTDEDAIIFTIKDFYCALNKKDSFGAIHYLEDKLDFYIPINFLGGYIWTDRIEGLNIWDVSFNTDYATCKIYFQEFVLENDLVLAFENFILKSYTGADKFSFYLELIEYWRQYGQIKNDNRFKEYSIEISDVEKSWLDYGLSKWDVLKNDFSLINGYFTPKKYHRLYDVHLSKNVRWKIAKMTNMLIK